MDRIRLLTLRSLRARPLRTLLTGFGVVLGVACLFAIQVTNQTTLDALLNLFADTSGRSDLVVVSGETRSRGLPESLLPRLTALPGVSAAVPSLQVQTVLEGQSTDQELDVGLSFMGVNLGGLTLYGIDPDVDRQVRGYRITRGEFLYPDLDAYEIVLVDTFAEENDIQTGDEIGLITPTGVGRVEVVGLMAREGPGQLNNGAFGVIPLGTAQELFNRVGELDQIDLLLEGDIIRGAALEGTRSALQTRLGEVALVTFPAARGQRVAQMLDGYQIGLNFLSGMALFVGAFLIYNAFSMTVVERTREFGFLRTLGMTRAGIVRQVLVEAGILGFLGAALGAGSGLYLARGLVRLLEGSFEQDLGRVTASRELWATSILVGVVVTLFAATVPAWQAGRISPLEALRVRSSRREGWFMRKGWSLGVILLLFSTYILVRNPFPYDAQFRLGSVTVVALFFGATLLLPVSVGTWERAVRPVVRRLYGNSGRLGSGNVRRAKTRTTLTVAALMVGVAMILITRGMTDSFRTDLEAWIQAYIGGDLFISSSVPMEEKVLRRIESVEGVAAVAPIRYLTVRWDRPESQSEVLSFMAFDPAAHNQVTSFVFSQSDEDPGAALSRLAQGDAIFISSVMAEKYDLAVGDSLPLRTRAGERFFEVAAVVVDFYNQGQVIQGSWRDMQRYFRMDDADVLLVQVGVGHPVEEVRQRIDGLYGQEHHLTVDSNRDLIDRALSLWRQANSLFDVLALIALFVAGLGVINTLTMNVVERTQEIGMLRSIGMTRGQVIRMILAEAGLMGLIGGALGLVFGALLTRIFLWAMRAMAGYNLPMVLSYRAIAVSMLVALALSQVAALFPARRAARIRILEAIHYE
jgi:putative ABC transport system permease protein